MHARLIQKNQIAKQNQLACGQTQHVPLLQLMHARLIQKNQIAKQNQLACGQIQIQNVPQMFATKMQIQQPVLPNHHVSGLDPSATPMFVNHLLMR
jgi:hypothetical protein